VRAECIRVARRLRATERKVIGLLPASSDVAVMPVGVQLAQALADVTSSAVAFVDANARWPALSSLVSENSLTDDESVFFTRWMYPTVALLIPAHRKEAGIGVPALGRLVPHARELFAVVLVDLTGFDKLGEHLAAAELTDGVVIVGRAQKTREGELLARAQEIGPDRMIGVLLTGGDPA
jgi:hypothetical protein